MMLLERYGHENIDGVFGEMIPFADYSDCLRIFVWTFPWSDPLVNTITEVTGNKTIHLTGQYYFRYDPPRTASSGAGEVPKGNCRVGTLHRKLVTALPLEPKFLTKRTTSLSVAIQIAAASPAKFWSKLNVNVVVAAKLGSY